MKYRRSEKYVQRTIMNKKMLFPIGEETKKYQGTIVLNDIASLIWDLMDDYVDENYIVKKILEMYDVSQEQAKQDVSLLLDSFKEHFLVIEKECD